MDKNDIIEYVMHTPHNTNRAVLSSMLNQLAEDGSGGSSDFSTAQVTVVNNTQEDVMMAQLPIVTTDLRVQGEVAKAEGGFVFGGLTETYTVLLAKDGCAFDDMGLPQHTLSGDITKVVEDDMATFVVTGDCTITFI